MELHEQIGSESEKEINKQSIPQSRNIFENIFRILDTIIRTDRDFNVKDTFIVDDFETKLLEGFKFSRRAFNTLVEGSVYSVTRSDYCIGITNLSYAPSVGLPKPSEAGVGKTYLIKDEAGEAGTTTITIRSTGEGQIEGTASTTIATAYGFRMFYTDGAQWFVGGS